MYLTFNFRCMLTVGAVCFEIGYALTERWEVGAQVSAHGSCCYWWWENALISTVWAILFWHYWAQKLTYPLTLWGSISGSFSVRKQICWLESQDYWKLTYLWPGLWTAFAQVYSASSQQKLKYRLKTSIAYKKPSVGVNKRWNVIEEFEGKAMQSQIPSSTSAKLTCIQSFGM